ncbi:MAG: hypothetical protein FJW31_06320 [Acidobacteria bacterium]|nr:hypothetical protein [Acidobacteriota bacterium]
MRRLLLALVVSTLAAGAATLEAGAARRIVTPDPLLPVSGGMGTPSPAKSKQGELTARALVIRAAGGEPLVLAGVDLLGFPSVLGNRARALVPRLAPERIVIGATHTHSAPDTYAFPDGRGGHTGSLAYMQFVAEQVAGAINDALDQMRPAEIRVASGEAKGKIAYNYYAPDLYDRRAGIIQLREAAAPRHAPIATLVNYAVHPEVLGSGQGVLSPDLAGPLYDRLEAAAGGGVAIFMNGAQGGMVTADNRNLHQSPRDPLRAYWDDSRTWAECVRIGELLASEALRIVSTAAWQASAAVENRYADVRFPVSSPDMWRVIRDSPLRYPHDAEARTVTARVNLLRIGDAQILTIPGEALPNIGLYLKRRMPGPHQFLFGLTNDAFGYILTEVDFQSFPRYGYVSRVSLGEQTGEILIREALALLGTRRADRVKE